MNDGDKQQQETTAMITAARMISSMPAQARDGVERDSGQAGGLGTAVCSMDKVRDKQSKICRGYEMEMMTEVAVQ